MPKLYQIKQRAPSTQWLGLGVALLILGGATAFDLYVERGYVESIIRSRLETPARVIQENLEKNLTALSQVLGDLGKEGQRSSVDPRLDQRLDMLADAMPGVRTLQLIDAHGTVLASNRPELKGRDFSRRDYFRVPRQNPDPETLYVSPPFETVLGVYGLNVVRTISGPRGEFAGIVAATLDPNYFKTLLNAVRYAPDMWTTVVHGDGVQFLMMPEPENLVGRTLAQPDSFFTQHMGSGKVASIFTGTAYATGEESMVALRTIRTTSLKQDKPLVVMVGRKLDIVYAEWRRDVWMHSGLFGLVALISALGLHAYQRRQREYARQEAADAAALAAGERFMKTLTDSLPGMVAYWTRDLRCSFANPVYFEWFGKTPEQMRGIGIRDLLGEELFLKTEPLIKAVLCGERQQFEGAVRKPDGRIGHTWIQCVPDLQPDGVRGFFVLATDITELKLAELALRESRDRLEGIYQSVGEGIVTIDAGQRIVMVNAAAQRIFGYTAAELLGQPLSMLIPERYRLEHDEHVRKLDIGGHGEPAKESYKKMYGLHASGREFPLEATVSRSGSDDGKQFTVVLRDISERVRVEEARDRLSRQLELLGAWRARSQDAERRQVAFELHEDLGQELAALRLYLQALRPERDGTQADTDHDEALSITKQAMERIRRLVLELYPRELDEFGLGAAVRLYCQAAAVSGGWQLTIDVPEPKARAPIMVERACFRILQAGLDNVLLHAKASEVWVQLHPRADTLELVLSDNGIGFDPKAVEDDHADEDGSVGIIEMQMRARRVGGSVEIKSAPGEGTEVRAIFPLSVTADATADA